MDPTQMMEPPKEEAVDQPGVPEESAGDMDASSSEEQPNVSPEEQKTYDATMTAALNLIYSKEGFPTTIRKLADFKDDIPKGVGHTAAMVLISVLQSVEDKGKTIPDDILFAAGQEIVSDLLRICEGSNLIDVGTAESLAEKSFYEGMKVFGQWMNDQGRITPDVKDQAKQALQEKGVQPPQQPAAAPTSNQPPQGAPPAGGIVNQAVGA
jgi:hypothetical protein